MEPCSAHGPVDEDRRGGPQGFQGPVEPARRDDDEPVDLPGQGAHGPDLFVRVLAGVDEQHLQVALPGRPFHRSHQGREVRVGDVGHDHGNVARPPGDQAAGRPVRHEAELPHRRLDPAPGLGCDLLGNIDGARDRGGMHAGACGNVEDRRPLLAPHGARPYSATSGLARRELSATDAQRLSTRTLAHAPCTVAPGVRPHRGARHRPHRIRVLRPGAPRRLRGRAAAPR